MAEQDTPNSPFSSRGHLPEAECAAAANDDIEFSHGSESPIASRWVDSDEFDEAEIEAAHQLLRMMEHGEPNADAGAGPSESQLVADEEAGTSNGGSGEANNEPSESQPGAVEVAGTSGGGEEESNVGPGFRVDWDERRRKERKEKNLRVARRHAEFFARFDPHDEDGRSYFSRLYGSGFQDVPVLNQSQDPPLETSEHAQLPLWQPSRSPADTSFHNRSPPSLLDLCLPVLAANAECIESLQGLPDSLMFQLSAAICGQSNGGSFTESLLSSDFPLSNSSPTLSLSTSDSTQLGTEMTKQYDSVSQSWAQQTEQTYNLQLALALRLVATTELTEEARKESPSPWSREVFMHEQTEEAAAHPTAGGAMVNRVYLLRPPGPNFFEGT